MGKTTIPLETEVRDRLRKFGHAGQTYNEIITQILDRVEMEEFVHWARERIAENDRTGAWIDVDDLDDL